MLIPSALMAPFYRGWEPNLQLNRDDSEAIQALYGKTKQNIDDPPAEASLTTTTTTSTTTQRPSVDEPTIPPVPETSGAGQHYFF
jgi:matrix metalloproteinase-14 (membrane-inserted)